MLCYMIHRYSQSKRKKVIFGIFDIESNSPMTNGEIREKPKSKSAYSEHAQ